MANIHLLSKFSATGGRVPSILRLTTTTIPRSPSNLKFTTTAIRPTHHLVLSRCCLKSTNPLPTPTPLLPSQSLQFQPKPKPKNNYYEEICRRGLKKSTAALILIAALLLSIPFWAPASVVGVLNKDDVAVEAGIKRWNILALILPHLAVGLILWNTVWDSLYKPSPKRDFVVARFQYYLRKSIEEAIDTLNRLNVEYKAKASKKPTIINGPNIVYLVNVFLVFKGNPRMIAVDKSQPCLTFVLAIGSIPLRETLKFELYSYSRSLLE